MTSNNKQKLLNSCDIIHLNVGGTRFSTSKETLTWVPDTFFTSLLSGRIASQRDSQGAIFIDRDPDLFSIVLNFLRTQSVDLKGADWRQLLHEAEYYSIAPLVRRLGLCASIRESSCGGILFHGMIATPAIIKSLKESGVAIGYVDDTACSNFLSSLVPNRHSFRYHSPSTSSNESSENVLINNPDHKRIENNVDDAFKSESFFSSSVSSPHKVVIVKGHINCIAVAYSHYVCLFKLKDTVGWNLVWTSPYMEDVVDHIAVNAKVSTPAQESCNRLIAAACGFVIKLWSINDNGDGREIGSFNQSAELEHLFFSGSQLVALSRVGKVGVWHARTQNWQIQDIAPICSFETAGTFLLLGCENGSIYHIDMQKFPLRMIDNDLLVTELYRDPAGEMVTALSVYLTPRTSLAGNWIEIAYGTNFGKVRIIVQHPETVGQGPQLFQTFSVHTSPVSKVALSEKNLISVCSDYNHVRSWSVTRFRNMISTQPGSVPLASFKVITLEHMQPILQYDAGNDIGPYGDKDDQQIFIQKVVPDTDTIFVRLSSTGKLVCTIKSVDCTKITSFCVHECEGSNRMGSRPRRYLFTGHSDGVIQIWDLSTALELSENENVVDHDGPSPADLMEQLNVFDLTNSCAPTPNISPSSSTLSALYPSLPRVQKSSSFRNRGHDMLNRSRPQSMSSRSTMNSSNVDNVPGS